MQVLRKFEHLSCICLEPPAPIFELMLLALEMEEAKGGWKVRDGGSQGMLAGEGGRKPRDVGR